MDAKIDAILHYIGDWIDDNYGERVEDCAEDLTEMIKKIGYNEDCDTCKHKGDTTYCFHGGRYEPIEKGESDIYPLTIIKDRYMGTYSGGKYLAFNLDFDEIPEDVIGSDVPCRQFFYETDLVYGKGSTVDEAIKDLARQIMERG